MDELKKTLFSQQAEQLYSIAARRHGSKIWIPKVCRTDGSNVEYVQASPFCHEFDGSGRSITVRRGVQCAAL